MRAKRPGRILAALGAAFVLPLVGPSPTWAHPADDPPSVGLNPAHAGMTAAEFPTKACDVIPGGASDTMDGWVFQLPADDAQLAAVFAAFHIGNGDLSDGKFNSVMITGQDAQQRNIHDPNGFVARNGAIQAWVQVPSDVRLSHGEAMLTEVSSAEYLDVANTCPAGYTEAAVPPASADPGGAAAAAPAADSAASLPVTGAAIRTLIAGGTILVLVGVSLAAARRRRPVRFRT